MCASEWAQPFHSCNYIARSVGSLLLLCPLVIEGLLREHVLRHEADAPVEGEISSIEELSEDYQRLFGP